MKPEWGGQFSMTQRRAGSSGWRLTDSHSQACPTMHLSTSHLSATISKERGEETMFRTIAGAICSLVCLAGIARAELDINDFKAQCEASGDWCAGYVQAILDTTRVRLCPPWGKQPHPTGPLAHVEAWLQAKKGIKGSASRTVETALADSFPCKR